MEDDEPVADVRRRDISEAQWGMIRLLGGPPIVAAAWTPRFLVHGEGESPSPFIKPPYTVAYLCPVIEVLGRPRAVQPNGDLHEVDPDRLRPLDPAWPR